MRFLSTSRNNHNKLSGFTLIEILIIAPIVIIAISGFIGLMVSVVGKVLLIRDQDAMAYSTQNALNQIEEDTRLSAKFLTTTGTLPSPQGSDNNYAGTAAFSSSTANTLIINALATDRNPQNSSRALIYYDNQPNSCGTTQSFNRVFSTQVIYFVYNNTLWRRTIVPTWDNNTSTPDANTICTQGSTYTSPWQQDSCSPGYTSSACQTNDEQIMNNITSLTVQYYSTPNGTTDLGPTGASSATTIQVTIVGGKTTAGHSFTYTATTRATKLNTINT